MLKKYRPTAFCLPIFKINGQMRNVNHLIKAKLVDRFKLNQKASWWKFICSHHWYGISVKTFTTQQFGQRENRRKFYLGWLRKEFLVVYALHSTHCQPRKPIFFPKAWIGHKDALSRQNSRFQIRCICCRY